jgi:CelD/BcsL family acetyltransferase involved in cellulose biosynthesis
MACEVILDYQEIAAESIDDAVELIGCVIENEGSNGFSFSFAQVAESSGLGAALGDARIARLASIQSRYQSICPTVTYPVTGKRGILGAFSGQQRRDYKIAGKLIKAAFPDFRVEHTLGREVTETCLQAVARVHRGNQFRRAGRSVFDDPNFIPFLLRQVELGAPLCVSLLREKEGGGILAFNIGYFSGDTFFYYLTAYEIRFASLSPGRWILADSIRHLADRVSGDCLRLDLLSGEEAYKGRWAKSYYQVTRYHVIPRRFPNLPRMAAYSTVYGLKGVKKRLLSCFGGKQLVDLEREETALPS